MLSVGQSDLQWLHPGEDISHASRWAKSERYKLMCKIIDKLYLSFNECRQRQVVKQVSEVFPHICIAILAQALIVETVNLSNLATLMVTTQNSDTIFEPDLAQARPFLLPDIGCIFASKHSVA